MGFFKDLFKQKEPESFPKYCPVRGKKQEHVFMKSGFSIVGSGIPMYHCVYCEGEVEGKADGPAPRPD